MLKFFSVGVSICTLCFTGCTMIVNATKIGKDTYTLSNPYRGKLYSDATKFCTQKNLLLKPTRERTVQGMIVLDFKCLPENSKEYQKDNRYDVTDTVIISSKMSSK